MSPQLISRSADLQRLKDEGFEIEVSSGYLILHNIPYVNDKKEIKYGALVSELSLAGDVTTTPSTHVLMFAGEHPCDKDGRPLTKIVHSTERKRIRDSLVTERTFSSKPASGYTDYYHKMSTYAALLSGPAEAIDSSVTARSHRVIESNDPESVFNYIDTASSRAGIMAATRRLEQVTVAIVGVGGTGSYILDMIAKTPVKAIHLFDGDKFLQHNAFRTPGAASIADLKAIPFKADYLTGIYSRMHRNIVPHPFHLDASNLKHLEGVDFVFLCIDAGQAKQPIIEKLEAMNTPFVDVGIGIEMIDDHLLGVLRVTTSTPSKRGHVREKGRISLAGDGGDNLYSKNIQIAELNALNAALAVVKWKKLLGVYIDLEQEHFSTYTIDGNKLINEDQP